MASVHNEHRSAPGAIVSRNARAKIARLALPSSPQQLLNTKIAAYIDKIAPRFEDRSGHDNALRLSHQSYRLRVFRAVRKWTAQNVPLSETILLVARNLPALIYPADLGAPNYRYEQVAKLISPWALAIRKACPHALDLQNSLEPVLNHLTSDNTQPQSTALRNLITWLGLASKLKPSQLPIRSDQQLIAIVKGKNFQLARWAVYGLTDTEKGVRFLTKSILDNTSVGIELRMAAFDAMFLQTKVENSYGHLPRLRRLAYPVLSRFILDKNEDIRLRRRARNAFLSDERNVFEKRLVRHLKTLDDDDPLRVKRLGRPK